MKGSDHSQNLENEAENPEIERESEIYRGKKRKRKKSKIPTNFRQLNPKREEGGKVQRRKNGGKNEKIKKEWKKRS